MASSSRLKPGERGTLTTSIDTHNRVGMTLKSVAVFTNDPAKSKVVLTLKADILGRELPLSPQ